MTHPTPRTDAHGMSLVSLLVAVMVLGVLTAAAVPAYQRLRERSFDTAALSDALNASRAVAALDTAADFTIAVRGPTAIRQLPGSRVTPGTTLFITRRVARDGTVAYQVRGSHQRGSGATFYVDNGLVYARPETPH